jgi:hypothetical protein
MHYFPQRPGTRQSYLLWQVLFIVIMEGLAREFGQEQEINSIQIIEEEVKLSLFTEGMIFPH